MGYAQNGATKLHFESFGAGNETIVLIPGLGLPGAGLKPVSELLEKSFRIVLVEPRGSGDSDAPDEPYTGSIVAADLKAMLDAADIESAHLLGLSMGGMIVQDFALRFPERIKSMILLSTLGSPDLWFTRLMRFRRDLIEREGLLEHFRISIMTISSPFAFRTIPDKIAMIEQSMRQSPPETHAYLRQVDYCLQHDLSEALGSLDIPALVITGSHDFLTPVPLGIELAQAIPGAQYRQFEGASHCLWIEYPEELAELCAEFISDVSQGGAAMP